MANDEDLFPSSLPTYQSPPHVFDGDMTEAVNNGQHEFYNSPDYFFDAKANAEFMDFTNGNSTVDPGALIAQSLRSSPRISSGDSQRSSLGSSDGSLMDVNMQDRERAPGRIPIPAYTFDRPATNGDHTGTTSKTVEDSVIGNDLFDFDSAASSPALVSREMASNPINLPIRSALNHGNFTFGHAPFAGGFVHQNSYEGSPLSIAPSTNRHLHSRQSSESQPQYIHGALLETQAQASMKFQPPTQPTPPAHDTTYSDKVFVPTKLHVSSLPKTQRVETQMHMKLTIWPLPQEVSKLHFQSYTMARTKLVMKPPPEKSPSMLELYAHCVCATAMEDPQKLKDAFDRAAETAGKEDPRSEDGNSSPKSLNMADDDPRKPKNGGFVFICDQCIRRENKRIARKKLKNDEEEESWLGAQPKRIIVFNKAEIMDWQQWSSYQEDGEAEEGNQRPPSGPSQFPDNAMQIRFPMRIQCYSRHHEEKLGYKVIFTIKDWKNRLIAQTITNAAIITDDHKAQQSTKNGGQNQAVNYFETANPPGAGIFSPQAASGNHGLPMINRNSFSTPDLQSLQHPQHYQMPPQYRPFSNIGGQQRTGQATATSRNASRAASPSPPSESRNKRRKGSSSGRIRSDLAMTQINPTNTAIPPVLGGPPLGPNYAVGSTGCPPFSPNYAPPHGLSTPPTSAHATTRPLAPSAFHNNFFQRSQSVEDLQSYQSIFSAPTSAYQSQAATPESSPHSLNQPQIRAQDLTNSFQYTPSTAAAGHNPNVHKVTPAEGPKAGGIEVTCLGEGFRLDSVVTFGDIPASTVSLYSEKALLCRLPPAAQAGPVRVTVSNSTGYSMPSPPHNEVYFRYIDNDEQEMMRHALQILNQQFSGGTAEAHEFARNILASMGVTQGFNGIVSSSNTQQRQASTAHDYSAKVESLENVILRCLEMVDLDEGPNLVNINFRDADGHGMLHAASSLGYYRLVAGLLARGADPDLRDNNGMTPTHIACLNGNVRIIRKLRSAGADSTIRSLNGIRPADVALSQQIRDAVEEFGFCPRSRSAGTVSSSYLSRTSSVISARSYRGTDRPTVSHIMPKNVDLAVSDDEEPSLFRSQPATPVKAWPRSRRESFCTSAHLSKDATEEKLKNDAEVFAASPAMSAWRDQISAQIQQLQQSVHRALPPIPNLPDYQAYPVVRRISNLVPQRSPRVEITDVSGAKLKESDYRWWELITGTASSPPAYEEIYPEKTQEQVDEKNAPALHAINEAFMDQKCETMYDQPGKSAMMATVNIGRDGWTKQQQQELRNAHARKVKRLRSDRNLFFFWIPLLLLIIFAMMKDRAPRIWAVARQTSSFLDDLINNRAMEVA